MKTKRFQLPRMTHPYTGTVSDRLHVLARKRNKLDARLEQDVNRHFPTGTTVIVRHTRRDDVGKFVGIEAEILLPRYSTSTAAIVAYRSEPDLETLYRVGLRIEYQRREAWLVDFYYLDLPSDAERRAEMLAGRGYVDTPAKPKRRPRRKGAVKR